MTTRASGAWAVAVTALLTTACGQAAGDARAVADGEQWTATAQAPLSPRHDALVLAVGGKGVVLGGADTPPCPPSASCAVPPNAFRDAAVYDPTSDTWRLGAPAPVALHALWPGASAVVGDTVYLLVSAGAATQARVFLS